MFKDELKAHNSLFHYSGVDMQPYSKVISLRAPDSCKLGNPFRKDKYTPLISDIDQYESVRFSESKQIKSTEKQIFLRDVPYDAIELVDGILNSGNWSISKITNKYINFKRLRESHCDICDRSHTSDSLYLYNNGEKWARSCFRARA